MKDKIDLIRRRLLENDQCHIEDVLEQWVPTAVRGKAKKFKFVGDDKGAKKCGSMKGNCA